MEKEDYPMKKLFSLVLVLAMALSLCMASASAEDLNIAYMPNYASLWSVVTGVNMGYFADEGLNVKLVEFADGPTIIAAMESGSIDMGYIGPGAHKLCINGRAKIFMLSQIGNADAVLARKSRGIETYADLKGKKVGYSSGTSSEMILQYALEEAGLTMNDIQAYEMEVSSLVSAMVSGSIDACAAWSPSTGTIIASDPDDIFSMCSNVTFADRSVSPASWIVLSGYYDDFNVSQVHAGAMVVFGDPWYAKQNDRVIKGEFAENGFEGNNVDFVRGTVGLTLDEGDPDSNFGDFFIVLDDAAKDDMNGKFCAIGRITEGIEILDEISMLKTAAAIKYQPYVSVRTLKVTVELKGGVYPTAETSERKNKPGYWDE